MTDQQPGQADPAAERDPTRVEGGAEPSTVDAPARWSGSAAIPPPAPKKSWWPRRRPEPEDERTGIPAVDPWAGQDTPIDTVVTTVAALEPAALVLAVMDAERLVPIASELEAMPTKVYVGGRGAAGYGTRLPADPAQAAREVVQANRG